MKNQKKVDGNPIQTKSRKLKIKHLKSIKGKWCGGPIGVGDIVMQ